MITEMVTNGGEAGRIYSVDTLDKGLIHNPGWTVPDVFILLRMM
jgi:hypothetical protein